MHDQPSDQAVLGQAERTVQIAAAMTYVDQARHLLDGQHDSCRACSSQVATRTVAVEDGIPHTEVVTVHEDDCPINDLQRAFLRLGHLFETA